MLHTRGCILSFPTLTLLRHEHSSVPMNALHESGLPGSVTTPSIPLTGRGCRCPCFVLIDNTAAHIPVSCGRIADAGGPREAPDPGRGKPPGPLAAADDPGPRFHARGSLPELLPSPPLSRPPWHGRSLPRTAGGVVPPSLPQHAAKRARRSERGGWLVLTSAGPRAGLC